MIIRSYIYHWHCQLIRYFCRLNDSVIKRFLTFNQRCRAIGVHEFLSCHNDISFELVYGLICKDKSRCWMNFFVGSMRKWLSFSVLFGQCCFEGKSLLCFVRADDDDRQMIHSLLNFLDESRWNFKLLEKMKVQNYEDFQISKYYFRRTYFRNGKNITKTRISEVHTWHWTEVRE